MLNKLRKTMRYLVTGYLFQRKKISKNLSKSSKIDWTCKKEKKLKIVVYTIIIGSYDSILEQSNYCDNIDYYILTNLPLPENSGWKKIDINNFEISSKLSDQEISRYFKIHPEILFEEYDYSIYIDGNIIINSDVSQIAYKMEEERKIICMHQHSTRNCIYDEGKAIYALGKASYSDIRKHLKKYKREGMPKHFGLFENNIIARKHNDPNCIKIMDLWWIEYINGCHRDQLSFMYSLWKNNYTKKFVKSMGINSRNNPMFTIVKHNNE